jgi:hypothetical protein
MSQLAPGQVLLLLGLLLLAESSCSPSGHLGEVRTSRPGDPPDSPRKMVVLRGRVLSGRVEATYAGGRSYLNGHLWRPQPIPKVAPNRLGDRALERMRPVPFVRSRLERGWTLEAAGNELVARQGAMLEEVDEAHRRNRFRGSNVAAESALAAIDTSVAVGDPRSPEGPKIFDDGSFQVHLRGVGTFVTIVAGSAKAEPSSRQDMSLARAKAEFAQLKLILGTPAPCLILYGSSGTMILSGSDAVEAQGELDRLLAASGEIESLVQRVQPSKLGKVMAREVVAEHRRLVAHRENPLAPGPVTD